MKLLAIFLGIGLVTGNLTAAVVMVVVPAVGLVRRITVEEAALREGIGDADAPYCQGRARLVPGPRSQRRGGGFRLPGYPPAADHPSHRGDELTCT